MTEREQKIYNYGILVGELGTIAEFNTKANQGFEFNLDRFPKSTDLKSGVSERIDYMSETFELIIIENDNAFKYFTEKLKAKWFFEYQNKDEPHLIDKGNSFNMFYSDYQQKYIVEFVNFLLQTLNPLKIYKIKFGTLKIHYPYEFNHYIFECEDADYHFALSVSD